MISLIINLAGFVLGFYIGAKATKAVMDHLNKK